MRKTVKTTLFFMAIVATAAFLTTGSALAFCDGCLPENFTDPGGTGWTITLVEGPTDIGPCSALDPYDTDGEATKFDHCYEWKYRATQNETYTGVNYNAMLLPNCCSEPKIWFSKDKSQPNNNSLKVFSIGEGNSDGFGKYLKVGYVVELAPDSTGEYTIVTTSNVVGSMPGVLRLDKKNQILYRVTGPSCTPPAPETVSYSYEKQQTFETKSGWKFFADCDKQTGCCSVYKIKRPDGSMKCDSTDDPNNIADCVGKPIENFLKAKKLNTYYNVTEATQPGVPCINLMGDDEHEDSAWYCSGGWCY